MPLKGAYFMESKVKEALQTFMEYNVEMQEALKELRGAVKVHGSASIQNYIEEENFDEANLVIEELNQFTNLDYISNFNAIYSFAEKILNEGPPSTIKANTKQKKFPNQYKNISVINEIPLNKEESEVIKELGYTSVSTYKNSNTEIINEKNIANLTNKGFVDIEEVELDGKIIVTFELNENGKLTFKNLFGIEPNESYKSLLLKKHDSLTTGLFLHEVETGFNKRGFQINDMSVNQIELMKDKRHTYITPDLGFFTEEEYFKILNRKNQLKNIGFVCIDSETMQRAQKATKSWANSNESKCKLLNVHFTTIENIENTPNIFETIKY